MGQKDYFVANRKKFKPLHFIKLQFIVLQGLFLTL
jgi:hypothetical protein